MVCDIDADEGRGDIKRGFVILTQTKVEEYKEGDL